MQAQSCYEVIAVTRRDYNFFVTGMRHIMQKQILENNAYLRHYFETWKQYNNRIVI